MREVASTKHLIK